MSVRARPLAVVTGANRGLGLETSRRLASAGFAVALTGRDARGIEAAAEKLREAGHDARGFALDVSDEASVAAFASRLPSELGLVAALVNNAGVSLDGFDASVAERTLETNFFGPMRLTDALVPSLAPDANVVMVSSGMGELSCLGPELRRAFADPNLMREDLVELAGRFVRDVERGSHRKRGWPSNAYRVSKVALNALTRVLARELAGRVKVNAVCPGWVRTRMGGEDAARSVVDGAQGIVWAAMLPKAAPTGGFFRDGVPAIW